ncbi:hypothetical protein GTP44_13440 [Duganella sp. FT50W]|uniref:Undecaprenyl/decaprenyl-phosphate alpha-N-acetylglucosaminyl 1-phosphate transferase n=1 Tax=Duganella lactea TaxID=2692173 RepID=A0A6L8MIK2_9BURK|nr:MraY family glycosyltransferase [Duganella lactea]MYM82957.1 hypothetical protein [Duganella lactea]
MNLVALTLLFLTAAAVAAAVSNLAIYAAPKLGFTAKPDPTVPNHVTSIPLLGGVAIMLGTMVGAPMLPVDLFNGCLLAGGALAVCALGAYKDRIGTPVSSLSQMVVQAVAVTAAVAAVGAPPITGVAWLDTLLAIVTSVWLVNSINFLDVMDGLAGGICLIACAGAVTVLAVNGAMAWIPLPLALAGGLFGFLIFNLHPARIFMGDIGSFGTGFVLVIIWLQVEHYCGSVVAALLVAVPLLEVPTSALLRLRNGTSPLNGDGTHISLLMLRHGGRVRLITAYFWIAEAVSVTVACGLTSLE